jgi:hypothetical protein
MRMKPDPKNLTPKICELAVKVEPKRPGLTGAPAPALRAAFEAVYLAPLDS